MYLTFYACTYHVLDFLIMYLVRTKYVFVLSTYLGTYVLTSNTINHNHNLKLFSFSIAGERDCLFEILKRFNCKQSLA